MSDATSNQDDERLVAYLDGELDDAHAIQVEQLLASAPELRHKVERLSRTWDLLDLLPSPRASQTFTDRTLTAVRNRTGAPVVVDEEEAASTQIKIVTISHPKRDRWKRIAIRGAAFLGLGLIASAGFRSSYDAGNQATEEMLRNYPVIRQLEEYREVHDVDFLQKLHDSGMFRSKGTNDDNTPDR